MPVKEGADGPVVDEKEKDKEEPVPETQSTPEKQDAALSADNGKEREKDKAGEDELPEDVRKKLAKLDGLTAKYQGMLDSTPLPRNWHLLFYSQNMLCTDLLRNYRTAHARVAAIEPFEATLREHTPLTSISDPGALIEFLNQRSVQSDMVKDELKRVSEQNREVIKERDELKVKLEEAEKKAKEAFDEAAGLRKEREEGAANADAEKDTAATESDPLGVTDKEADPAPSSVAKAEEDETFFSYETELPRLEAEVEKQKDEIEHQRDYINELSTENATIRQDLETCQVDLSAMQNKITIKEREINNLQVQLQESKDHLEEARKQEQEAIDSLTKTQGLVSDLPEEYRKANGEPKNEEDVQREEKMKQIHQNVVNALKEQVKQAEEAKAVAEGKVNELQFGIKRLESEADASGEIITRLRGHEAAAESWKKKLVDAENERDDAQRLAESKKGHEAAVASLRSQLKRAEKDRDAAYQMILDCGKCALPEAEEERSLELAMEGSTPARSRGDSEATEQTEVSTQPTEVSTPTLSVDSRDLGVTDAKKKKKKKSKAKKKEASDASPAMSPAPMTESSAPSISAPTKENPMPSIQELIDDPSKANDILAKRQNDSLFRNFMRELVDRVKEDRAKGAEEQTEHQQEIDNKDQLILDREKVIRQKSEEITTLTRKIGEQEAAIERLDKKLQGEDGLREEIETLREAMIEAGSESTDAKHELKTLKEQKEKLQAEFDELEAENARIRKSLKDAETQRDSHLEKSKGLEAENEELKSSQSASSVLEVKMQAMAEKLQASETTGKALQVAKEACEKQIEELKAQHTTNGAELDAKHQSLSKDFDELKSKATGLETDLAAANQLAQSRFKDLTDLREHLNKVQPELKRLRQETEELKTAKADFEKASGNVKRLEARETELKAEVAEHKSENATLKDMVKKGDERSTALEDTYERTRKDLEQNERVRDEAVEKRDKAQADLKKVEEELKGSKTSLDDLEKQVNKFRDEAASLRDEIHLRSAQQASAQSLVDNMQDQSRELAIQMKEIKERNESLEEELGDAHRLLSERGREGETMRRLLADIEGRAESKVKDMRERLDLATEERDRAEDEASNIGRRKAREIEDLRTKLSYAEREASRAAEAREDAEKREREFKNRQDDLEQRASQAQEELAEVRSAMTQLRDALDEGERQSQDLEKQKANLRKALDEREARLEKLQKSSKSMAEELRSLQAASKLRPGSNLQSSRSSAESSRVTSPAPRASNGTPTPASSQGKEVDTAYLKQVLLQFLEQKEKKHQMQLVPVLGMLLHFDK